MANNNNKNFVETMLDAQKQMVETVTEQTKKFANGNTAAKETVEKGSEWYKNWLDSQNNMFTSAKAKAADMTGKGQESADKMTEFYQNWMNNQMEMAKQMWEMNMTHMKNNTQMPNNNDPMQMWNNWTNNMQSMYNNMNQANQWNDMMKKYQSMNPMNMDTWKDTANNWTNMFNQYSEMLNSSFANMQKDMQNGTTQDAFRNMVNVSEAFTRFSEMWAPFWKSIQDKSFNTEMFKQYANPAMYQDMMDKYFGFMPEQSREYVKNMQNMMQQNMQNMSKNGMGGYNQMRDMMANMMPGQNDIFGNMMNGYNKFNSMMNEAVAPFSKMMGTDKNVKAMTEWSDIANRMVAYNIKNSELQYMVYNQGTKVMDKLAEYVAKKIESGEELNSMMTVYQEWLNIGDTTFVELFESQEYSKMMAEVNAMQLKLRKDVEKQLEKSMTGIPVATRSEMDELYKTIYDLKKEVREMEKAMKATKATPAAPKAASTVKNAAPAKPTVAKAAPAKKAAAPAKKTATAKKK